MLPGVEEGKKGRGGAYGEASQWEALATQLHSQPCHLGTVEPDVEMEALIRHLLTACCTTSKALVGRQFGR